MEIVALVVAAAHAYAGRPAEGPRPVATSTPAAITLRAGHGVVGDRYAGAPAHVDARLTVVAAEALEAVAAQLGAAPFDPVALRRTVVVRGVDVEALRGVDFTLDSGDGPVRLGGRRPAAPCAWMDVVLAPGAHAALRGRAGVRCAVLSAGTLRVGPVTVGAPVPLDPARAGLRPPRAASPPPRRPRPTTPPSATGW